MTNNNLFSSIKFDQLLNLVSDPAHGLQAQQPVKDQNGTRVDKMPPAQVVVKLQTPHLATVCFDNPCQTQQSAKPTNANIIYHLIAHK
jgi:hypothetical protein